VSGTRDALSGRVAVVVPCLDEHATIRACILSARRQEPPPARIVVVDNGSTDGSLAEAEALADHVVEDAGATIGRLRNVGALAAGACDILAFLDGDCTAEPGWLAAALGALKDGDVVGARTEAPSGGSWVACRWAQVEARLARTASYVGSANMAVRRDVFERVGGFDESLGTSEDVDLCERIVAAGGRVVLVPLMRVVHHGAPANLKAFARRQLWHASVPSWWWKASPRARALVAATLAWDGLGVAALFAGVVLASWWAAAGWTLTTLVAVLLLGALVGSGRHAPADGALLALWAVTHAARLRTGRRKRR
jgi:GT2 family glycosyltransferase